MIIAMQLEMIVDIERCDLGDPCSEVDTYCIHKIRYYFRVAGQNNPKEEAREYNTCCISAP